MQVASALYVAQRVLHGQPAMGKRTLDCNNIDEI